MPSIDIQENHIRLIDTYKHKFKKYVYIVINQKNNIVELQLHNYSKILFQNRTIQYLFYKITSFKKKIMNFLGLISNEYLI